MTAEPNRDAHRTREEILADELEREGAPEWGEGNEPTIADFLKATARAVKYLKHLKP